MLTALFEIVFQVVIELVFEFVGEIFAELGFSAWERTGKLAANNSSVVMLGYALFGVLLGGLTAWFFPGHIIQSEAVRLVNSIISPILLGFSLCLVSWIIRRRDIGEGLFRRDKFLQGVVFALSYSLTRYYLVG